MRNAIIATVAVAALAIAGQAGAHARLITGAPKAGSTVAPPKQLTLHYSERIVPGASHVAVTGPGGGAVATGPMAVDAKTKRIVTVPFTGKPATGAYKVVWHMKTEDGHETDGDFAFTVK